MVVGAVVRGPRAGDDEGTLRTWGALESRQGRRRAVRVAGERNTLGRMPGRRCYTAEDHVIRLRDGRTLGFAEYGDPGGMPVICNHGGLSSRLDVAPAHESAKQHRLRLLAPDRPGIGLSSRKP